MRDGDAFNATNTNATVDDLINRVNNLTLEGNVKPRSLQEAHLPSLLGDDAGTDKLKGDSMGVSIPAADWPGTIAFQSYSNELSPVGAWPKDLQAVAGEGPGGGAGWRVVSRSGVSPAKVTWPEGTDLTDYASVLVSASVVIGHADNTAFTGGELFQMAGRDHCFGLALALKTTAAGNYYVIPRTFRGFNGLTSPGERVSLTTLLTQLDLDAAVPLVGGAATLVEVALVFGRFLPTKTPGYSIEPNGHIELGPYHITQMPFHHGTLV